MAGMFRELRADEIECRVSQVVQRERNSGVILLLYKDARTDANVLDETVGEANWQNRFYECKGNLFCSVGVKIKYADGKGEWIWKDDCGTESRSEAQKGEASDAFKRACFKWGLGRELYTAPLIWVNAADCEKLKDGKCYDRFTVRLIDYDGGNISKLVIENQKHNVVFTYGDLR